LAASRSVSKVSALFVIGTRPEAIKMAPLVLKCARRDDLARPTIVVTGQHRELLAPVLEFFGITPDVDLALMRPGQSLGELTGRLLQGVEAVIEQCHPECVVAQGDTTSVMAAALAAFYQKTPFVHVEAGLRTLDLQAPWPEELNRRIVTLAAALHCAPTMRAAQTLAAEGVPKARVHVTGNTVVDALLWTVEQVRRDPSAWLSKYAYLDGQPLVLVTGHRRENFGRGLVQLCEAVVRLAAQFPSAQFVYPVHLNPEVLSVVHERLSGLSNVRLIGPACYPEFVWLMDRSTLVLTDSGGIQEEAPSLGKPVLVTREATERPEALESGAVELVGTSAETIVARVARLLDEPAERQRRRAAVNPFGDGHAAERIAGLIAARAWMA
jgi:UDP-N-acetylglucosamine 2-epimerase (non-hydrolysing)